MGYWTCQFWVFLPILRSYGSRNIYSLHTAKISFSHLLLLLFVFGNQKAKCSDFGYPEASSFSSSAPLRLGRNSWSAMGSRLLRTLISQRQLEILGWKRKMTLVCIQPISKMSSSSQWSIFSLIILCLYNQQMHLSGDF